MLYLQLDTEAAPDANVGASSEVATVEILCYDNDEVEDISRLLDSAIEDLHIKDKIYPELRNTIMNDIILAYGSKSLMYRKYSELLQKQYHMTSLDPPESCIKKLLTTVVPRVILLRTKPTSQPSSISLDSAVTVDDAKVLKYISDALLRWGLKTFKGDDAKWLSSQISSSDTLSPEFANNNKGHLICPSSNFLSIITATELEFRRHIPPKSVDEQSIIDTVKLSEHVGMYFSTVLERLLRRFVRVRAHIHWRTLLLGHKQSKLKNRRSKALRKSLKEAKQGNMLK